MVKLKGPSLATEATGSLADALIFSTTKKRSYLKKHAKPANPNTQAQQSVRAMITFLTKNWKNLTPIQQATWNTPAFLEKIAPYHAYLKINMKRWRTFRGPGKAYPVPESAPIAGSVYMELFSGVRNINTRLTSGGGIVPWGYIIWRHDVDFNPPTLEMTVNVSPRISAGWNYWRDTPLPPGTYWYRKGNFTDDGQIRIFGGSHSAAAT